MDPSVLKFGSIRLARCAASLAGAALLVTALTACGGDEGEPSSVYHSICKVQKTCLDDEFVRTHGTVDGCAAAMKANAELSTKSEACLEATSANIECRADNAQCSNNQVAYGGRCESQRLAQLTACREAVASTATFVRICEITKECVGDTQFNTDFGSLAGCVGEYEASFSQLTQSCKELASDLVYCSVDNFVCEQGREQSPPECVSVTDAFTSECRSN